MTSSLSYLQFLHLQIYLEYSLGPVKVKTGTWVGSLWKVSSLWQSKQCVVGGTKKAKDFPSLIAKASIIGVPLSVSGYDDIDDKSFVSPQEDSISLMFNSLLTS